MKKLLLILFILPFTLFAQEKAGINFETGTWSEVIAKSKETGKPIFLDCYTSWCGPCKTMAATIFVDKTVGDYFNENFINMKIDMEKGEGIELRKKYSISVYPTLLFIDSDGAVVNRMIGGVSDANKFLEKVKQGLETKVLYNLQKKYDSGERGDDFILSYLKELEAAYLRNEAQAVVLDFFKDKKDFTKLYERKFWGMFEVFVTDVNSEIFKYVHDNRVELAEKHTKRALDNKLYQMWLGSAVKFVKKNKDGKMVLDKKGFDKYIARMKKEKADYLPVLIANAKISNAGKLGNWSEYVTLIEERVNNPQGVNISSATMVEFGRSIVNKCTDIDLRKRCIPMFEKALVDLAKTKKESTAPGTSMKESFAKAYEVATNEKILNEILVELKK